MPAITMAMKEAISVSGEYEQSIANVQSVVMGARDVFVQLDEAAKFAGQSTRFTASQAADALATGGLATVRTQRGAHLAGRQPVHSGVVAERNKE